MITGEGGSLRAHFAATTVLLGVAFAGATVAGVLAVVGPYLFGVSVLVAALFVLEVL